MREYTARNPYPFHTGDAIMAAPTHRPWEVLISREEQLTEKWFLIGWCSGIISATVCVLVYLALR